MANKSGKKPGKNPTKKATPNNKAKKKVSPQMTKTKALNNIKSSKQSMGSFEKKDKALRKKHKKFIYGDGFRFFEGKTLKEIFKETIDASSSVSDFYRVIQDAETECELGIPVGNEQSSLALRELRRAKKKGLDIHEIWKEAKKAKRKPTGKLIESIIDDNCGPDTDDSNNEESKAVELVKEVAEEIDDDHEVIETIFMVLSMKTGLG